MNIVYTILITTFALILYLFATRDNPFIPEELKEKPYKSKEEIINWYAWRGPMFREDFGNIGNKPGYYANAMPYETFESTDDVENFGNYTLPSDPSSCAGVKDACKRKTKFYKDHQCCHEEAYKECGRYPDLETSEDSYRNEYHNCSFRMRAPNPETGDLGNFKQCTNNNLDTPNQLKCVTNGRWDHDTCKPVDRVSHVCYKRNYDKCMRSKGHKVY